MVTRDCPYSSSVSTNHCCSKPSVNDVEYNNLLYKKEDIRTITREPFCDKLMQREDDETMFEVLRTYEMFEAVYTVTNNEEFESSSFKREVYETLLGMRVTNNSMSRKELFRSESSE